MGDLVGGVLGAARVVGGSDLVQAGRRRDAEDGVPIGISCVVRRIDRRRDCGCRLFLPAVRLFFTASGRVALSVDLRVIGGFLRRADLPILFLLQELQVFLRAARFVGEPPLRFSPFQRRAAQRFRGFVTARRALVALGHVSAAQAAHVE